MRFLIDECLHPSLTIVAHDRGFEAHHVTRIGLTSEADWDLVRLVIERDFTFVTNNAADFRRLYGNQPLHTGLVIIIPQLRPQRQRDIFNLTIDEIGDSDLLNVVIEAGIDGGVAVFNRYDWPPV